MSSIISSMSSKKKIQKNLVFFMVTLIIITTLPLHTFATSNPWDQYAHYLPKETPIAKRDLRGTWISTVINLDWPSAETIKIANDQERIKKSKEELIAILDNAVEMNMNAIFFQVSPEGDALYQSDIVNWSRYLTGTFGKDPGFDPLAFVIEEAHKRNLELHAWFNPYRISMNTSDATKASLNIDKSVYKDHPQWVRTAMSRFVVDPGIPEARKWVVDRVMEVVKNYDIDGIHFDDYFYYESTNNELQDDETYKKYNSGQFSNKADWRRNNTYLLIKELSNKISATKPWVKFGISPTAVWGNQRDGHSNGTNTSAGQPNYDRSYADTKKWIEEEIIDYIAPQIYFTFGNTRVPYGEVADWWSRVVKGKNVHLYIGQALYKVNSDADPYFNGSSSVEEFERQLKFNILNSEIKGSIMFRYQNFNDINKLSVVNMIKEKPWSTKAIVPIMPWKGGKAPNAPTLGRMENTDKGIKVTWMDHDPNTSYYGIYRIDKGADFDRNRNDSARSLVTTIRKNTNGLQEFIDQEKNIDPTKTAYVITALDRLHHESNELFVGITISKYFNDISTNYAWAVSAIDYFYEKQIVFGTGNDLFSPANNTKRGDFILMVVRALDLKADFKDNFGDVPKSSYYYDAIGTAKALGIAKGSGNNAFNPNGNISREDMMVIMNRVIEKSGVRLEPAGEEALSGYHDAHQISNYARESVARLTKAGLVVGSGGGVKPKDLATRAEIVVILDRLLKIIN
ncbi:family 10 glycosylhydrolase [Alkaliphilus transvaalensis]|uniref:family 10 glycosylhydrolase n=1 Tax=Alkaliphilus transvaalensis TaxID=114628 RepID=UPI000AD6D21D|nr:family 10 glycosylhydrolase [Alkaliphilus transvaalensis]